MERLQQSCPASISKAALKLVATVALIAAALAAAPAIAAATSSRPLWFPASPVALPSAALTIGQSASFGAISCYSAESCVAVGNYTDADGQEAFIVPVVDGALGTASEVRLPGGAVTAGQVALLNAVTCTSSTFCIAVGEYKNSAGYAPFIVPVIDGAPGTPSEVTLPGDAVDSSQDNDLDAVSCASTTSCIAVGSYENSEGDQGIVVPVTDGVAGTVSVLSLPGDAVTSNQDAVFNDVTCTSSTSCVAVGGYRRAGGSTGLVVPVTDGAAGTPSVVSLPSDAVTSNQGAYLSAVSCSSSSSCVAVGDYTTASGTDGLIVPLTDGSAGAASGVVLPADSVGATIQEATLENVTCSSASMCAAVGYFTNATGNEGLVVPITNGAQGTSSEVNLPSNALPTGQYVQLGAVSCFTSGSCTAGGWYLTASGTEPLAVSVTNGAAGTASEVTPPSGSLTTGALAYLSSLACTGVDSCVAVGTFTTAQGSRPMIASSLPVLSLTTATLPSGAVGHAYSATLTASGGTGDYTYSIASGTLPAGLALNPSTGVISGTPTTWGNASVTFSVADPGPPSQQASATLSIMVAEPANAATPAGVSTASFGPPTSITAVSNAITVASATEGSATGSLSIPAGALPTGTVVSIYPVTNSASLSSEVPTGQSFVVSFAVSWEAPNGTSPSASAPITMTITDPGILSGDVIYEVTSSGLTAVGIATANGVATITFTNDPTFIVAAVPKLGLVTKLGKVTTKGVQFKLSCSTATSCRGSAKLSVARRSKHGTATIVTHVTVASARFSLAKGHTATVTFRITAPGRVVLARRTLVRGFAMTLVTTVTGGSRNVERVFVR